jgi:hypothetical protein
MEGAFSKPTEQVLKNLGVNPTTGLTDEQVKAQRVKHGSNGMSWQRLSREKMRFN